MNEIAKIDKSQMIKEVESASKYLKDSLSENTKKAYKTQWDQFNAWCMVRGFDALPATSEIVCIFISWMADNNKKAATIARMLSTISKAHGVFDGSIVNPVRTQMVKDEFSGIKRKIGTDQNRVDPISIKDIKKIVDSFECDVEGIRNKALILLGFFGGFRRSELVAVIRKDVKFSEEGMRVKIAKSKTDQEGKGFFKSIPKYEDQTYCPVLALQDWVNIAPDSRFLFCHIEGASGPVKEGRKLSDKMVARLIQRIAYKLDIKGWFSGHSLRSGFVTAAAKSGKSNRSIMKMTGHKSYAMVDRYVRLANEFEDNAAEGLLSEKK
jgi:site-specific recombinase XerD